MNAGMILAIFFAILLGMMTGLTLFATNLQGILEIILVYTFFFWEKESMKGLLRKNLASHKQRNYLTSIIYALTLGCIIFLLVTASLQIQSITSMNSIKEADLYLSKTLQVNATLADPILQQYADDIRSFGYVSSEVNRYQNPDSATIRWSDRANLRSKSVATRAL